MRFTRPNRLQPYIIVTVILLAMVALLIYMWMDARKLERSLSGKTKLVQKTNESSTVQKQDTTSDQKSQARPANRMRPPRRKRPERSKVAANDEQKGASSTHGERSAARTTDDWMFEKSEDLEGPSEEESGNENQTPSE